jgi:ArsR family transcriptional regulator, nickel/cobalt-responsive transcriptional repressor
MNRQIRLYQQLLNDQSEAEKETIRLFGDCAQQLSAVADTNRLMIISTLLNGSANESALAQVVGIDIASVSHHLGVLKEAGLIIVERDGSQRIYSLAPGVGLPAECGSPPRIVLNGCVIELGN